MKKLMFTMVMAAALEGFASFSYQGALKLADGSPVTDRNVTLEFRIYDAPGNDAKVLWAGQQAVVVSPSNGLFNVEIRDGMPELGGCPQPPIDGVIATTKDLYIGLKVKDSSGEIRPRQRILPVPTASFAQNVNKASDNFTVSSNLLVNGATEIKGTTRLSGDAIVSGTLKIGNPETEVVPVPIGGIIMWSQGDAPDGNGWANDSGNDNAHWAICDGSTVNGVQTPNLVDRFVVGTIPNNPPTYKLGDRGGMANVTLEVSQMPSHLHQVKGTLHTYVKVHAGDNAQMTHVYNHDATSKTGHDEPSNFTLNTTTPQGEGRPHENRPPYYALYYIMRVR